MQIAPRSYERSVRDCISYPLEVSYHLCTYLHIYCGMDELRHLSDIPTVHDDVHVMLPAVA